MAPTTEIARRLAVWVPVYVLAGWLGRLTVIDDGSMSLVWPAAGVGALWLASASRRSLPADVVAFAGAVFVVNLTTGAPATLALVFVVANLLQAATFVAVNRLTSGHLFLFGGREPVSSLRDLGALVAAAAAASTVGATVGGVGLPLVGMDVTPLGLVVWWSRNNAGLVLVALLGLLVLHRVGVLTGTLERPVGLGVRRSLVEASALWIMSAGVLWVVFGQADVLPLSFLMLFGTVLVSVRLGPLTVAVHALVVGFAAVGATLAGRGPFAGVADLTERALVAQLFVTMAVITGLVLAISRLERDRATAELGRLEQETSARARLLEGVLESMQEGVAVIGDGDRLVLGNPAGDRLLGRDIGQRVDPDAVARDYGMTHLDGRELLADEVPHVRARQGETVRQDYLLHRSVEPSPIVLEVTASPLPEGSGEALQALVTYRDVTALRHDRDALATFAGVVAHDLKRPLTVIRGWTDALDDDLRAGELEREAGLSMLGRVGGAARQMDRLLDDLLHYTVVRDAPVHLQPLDVSAAAEECAAAFRECDAAPRISVAPGLRAQADPVMLRQVLDNLVGNAVKYVAPGVRPDIAVEGVTDAGETVLTVTDNGIGIAEGDRARVFASFQRAHGGDYRGTGLGLAIVHRAVERCGGTVAVSGRPGGGSVFEVRLPAVTDVPPVAPLRAVPPPQRPAAAVAG